jgi:hypothetical protein
VTAELRFRQVHLDFHTSEHIARVGDRFDPDEFAAVLRAARVDSITCFSRCHHGWIYHQTRFAARHPHLTRNLLQEQIEACHRAGIRVPVYITVGWDELMAREHPEWCEVTPDGRLTQTAPLQAGWHKLCLNRQPYVDYVVAQTEEVLSLFAVDGLFFDIIFQGECCCSACLRGMAEEGLDPTHSPHRRLYADQVIDRLQGRLTGAVRRLNRTCTIFFNAGHVGPTTRRRLANYTHLELESLPSGGWGYDHFPLTARYARRLGLDFLGMTGKFLKSWGDFGGFKTEAGLEYDCFTALAFGGRCSVGDQLHPSGAINRATYALIGHVYRQVEQREPWCREAVPEAEIGLLNPEAWRPEEGRVPLPAAGALRILQEGHHQFDVLDGASDWSPYRVLVLPDAVPIGTELRERLERFAAGGGAVLCSHESAFGVAVKGDSPFEPDYLVPGPALALRIGGQETAGTPLVMYERAKQVEAEGATVLARTVQPYFNRTWRHFSSHRQTPDGPEEGPPAIVRSGRVIYFAHPIFRMYARHGARAYREMVLGALALLLPDPLLRSAAPATARITVNRQPGHGRTVIHLLHYIPERKAEGYDVVEEPLPLYDLRLSVRTGAPVARAYLAPSHQAVPFALHDGRVELTVPAVRGHAMVVLEEERQ